MTSEYPDNDQRMAVCASSFNSTKEQIRRDVFTTEEEAQARAEEIGCSGIHEHDEDGEENPGAKAAAPVGDKAAQSDGSAQTSSINDAGDMGKQYSCPAQLMMNI